MSSLCNYLIKGDISIYYLFNRKIHCSILDAFMNIITHFGSVVFSIAFPFILLFFPKKEVKDIGMDLVYIVSISQLIVHSIKRIIKRPRPYKMLKNAIAINPPSCKYSFPSGHTCAAFSFAFPLIKHIPLWTSMFVTIAVLVGISRIYLGFHYPTDVFIGCFIAYTTYIVYWNFLKVLI